MKILRIKKGFNHPLSEVKITANFQTNLPEPEKIAVLPFVLKGLKPKLNVSENDFVKTGTPLFYHKNNPDIVFVSPGCGKISKIETGAKRIIQKIEIELDETEDFEQLHSVTEGSLRNISREDLVEVLLKNGLWPFFRSLPFDTIPDPQEKPDIILVKLSDNAPFYPLPESWLKYRLKAFNHGVSILKKISASVAVYADKNNHSIGECAASINYLVEGNYPAFDPGVVFYKIKEKSGLKAWYIDGQSLINIGETLSHGRFFTDKVFIVGSTVSERPYHVKSRIGAPVSSLISSETIFNEKQRFISGDVFRGITTSDDGYTGFYESSLTIVPEGDNKEFFGFIKPGIKKQSYSRTFLSALFSSSDTNTDCNTHGEKRACINCTYCDQVCPVDILPQFTMKALYGDDIESALAHGLLDCTGCALCSYVCPSKISLSEIFKEAKDNYLKEEKA
ncbi:MAG: 4Fe-4S dicluster domain-containing protein [Desulfobacteraceae bacterium]|nr:4Fe-4S dicluster domain-containing protein [Desulfobacteraceae bacterium]